jgi:hypothetical protein
MEITSIRLSVSIFRHSKQSLCSDKTSCIKHMNGIEWRIQFEQASFQYVGFKVLTAVVINVDPSRSSYLPKCRAA